MSNIARYRLGRGFNNGGAKSASGASSPPSPHATSQDTNPILHNTQGTSVRSLEVSRDFLRKSQGIVPRFVKI